MTTFFLAMTFLCIQASLDFIVQYAVAILKVECKMKEEDFLVISIRLFGFFKEFHSFQQISSLNVWFQQKVHSQQVGPIVRTPERMPHDICSTPFSGFDAS